MEIDNFDLIKGFCHIPTTRDHHGEYFYYVQILSRSKDGWQLPFGDKTGKGGNNANRALRTYVFNNDNEFDKFKPEIISFCKFFHARAYINPTPRSHTRVAQIMMRNLASTLLSNNEFTVWRLYGESVGDAAARTDEVPKRWVIDVDEKDDKKVQEVIDFIEKRDPVTENKRKTVAVVPTKSGYHIICTAFDRREWPFKSISKDGKEVPMDVHTNNLTLLYMPDFDDFVNPWPRLNR